MIRALISGELFADPIERTTAAGKPFATARLSVPQAEGDRLFASLVTFEADAVARLLQLKKGASVSAAGTLKVATWQARDGATKPSLDLVADEIASTTPRPRKPKAPSKAQAEDVDWMSA